MYPFSKYPVPLGNPLCPLPNSVDNIQTSLQCRTLVNEARDAAIIKSAALNDPTFYEFAEAFNIFSNADQATIKTHGNNSQVLEFHGGCDLLIRQDTRTTLWPIAREVLRKQLQRYHANQRAIPSGEKNPTLSCFTNNDSQFKCT